MSRAYPTHVGTFDVTGNTRSEVIDRAAKIVASKAFGFDVQYRIGPMRPLQMGCLVDGVGYWEATCEVYGPPESLSAEGTPNQ